MRRLLLAIGLVLGLGVGSAEAGPWHHFHLNLGKRLGARLHSLGHRHHYHRHHYWRHRR